MMSPPGDDPQPPQHSPQPSQPHRPSTYWRALVQRLHHKPPTAEESGLLDVGLFLVFLVGAWGAYSSLSPPAAAADAKGKETTLIRGTCRDVTTYVWLLTAGLGLYLAQNFLHWVQRRLLIAVWEQTYHRQHPASASKDVQAEDVVAHVRGLQRLEGLRNHATPGLPMLFLFSWLYAGAVDTHSGCLTRYPALNAAFHVFSWMGYSAALVSVISLIVQCACMTTLEEGDPLAPSSPSSNAGGGLGSPLESLLTSEWCAPVRRALALVLGPLSLLLPTDMVPPPSLYDGDMLSSTPFLASSPEQLPHQGEIVVEESISDLEYLHSAATSTTSTTTTTRRSTSTHALSSTPHHHQQQPSQPHDPAAPTNQWLIPPEIMQTALESSPFAIRHRTPRSGRGASSSSSRTTTRNATTPNQPPSSPSRRRTPPVAPKRTSSHSFGQILCSALWACLHVAILCLVSMSFFLLGRTSALPSAEMEACGAVRGFLFTMAMGFSMYMGLAVWMWAEKERSFREDPQEHALKGLWLLRGLVSLLSIGFVWGMMVLQETTCYATQPKLQEAVMAFILLGSSLLAIALALHGIATGVWAANSVVKVVMGLCEALALFLSLTLGLAPHQDLLGGQYQAKWLNESERRPSSPNLMIQVAEELPLLPFFHIRVIEEGMGSGSPNTTHDNDEDGQESKQQHLLSPEEEAAAALLPPRAFTYLPPPMPSTPIGRVVGAGTRQDPTKERGWRKQQARHLQHSRLGFFTDEDHDTDDEVHLPAAVPVSLVGQEGGAGGGSSTTQQQQQHQTRPLVLGATLHSIFDVTPLSLSPPRPASAARAVLLLPPASEGDARPPSSAPIGGGGGGGNTCCPLPPLHV